MKSALITGSAGFIGTALSRHLEASGVTVFPFDLPRHDVLDARDIRETVAFHRPDVIYHLAAVTSNQRALADPAFCYRLNILGTLNVLEAARLAGTWRILVASTDQVGYCEQLCPAGPYATSKACADLLANEYARRGLSASVLRHPNVYGPGDIHPDRLVPRTIERILHSKRPVIRGEAERSWLFIDDLVERYEDLASELPGPYAIAGHTATVKDIVRLLLGLLDSSVEPIIEPATDAIHFVRADSFGCPVLSSPTGLELGLSKTVEWHRACPRYEQ